MPIWRGRRRVLGGVRCAHSGRPPVASEWTVPEPTSRPTGGCTPQVAVNRSVVRSGALGLARRCCRRSVARRGTRRLGSRRHGLHRFGTRRLGSRRHGLHTGLVPVGSVSVGAVSTGSLLAGVVPSSNRVKKRSSREPAGVPIGSTLIRGPVTWPGAVLAGGGAFAAELDGELGGGRRSVPATPLRHLRPPAGLPGERSRSRSAKLR